MNYAKDNLIFDPAIIRRFDVNGPRYTSYPTADRFVEAFDSDAAKLWLGKRNIGGITNPLSLYFHIPFCNTICYYCACNKNHHQGPWAQRQIPEISGQGAGFAGRQFGRRRW